MPLTPEQLAKVLDNSKKLCTPQGDAIMEAYAKPTLKNQQAAKVAQNQMNTFQDFQPYDDGYGQPETFNDMAESIQSHYTDEQVMKSKLPDAVKKSLMENRIPQEEFEPNHLDSVTEMLLKRKQQQRQQQLTEQNLTMTPNNYGSYVPVQPVANQVQIDYNYIKHIVSECIKEYFDKQPLNEGATLKQIGLSEGKIKLVDNRGNVYSAMLEYKGNLEDKKKK